MTSKQSATVLSIMSLAASLKIIKIIVDPIYVVIV